MYNSLNTQVEVQQSQRFIERELHLNPLQSFFSIFLHEII